MSILKAGLVMGTLLVVGLATGCSQTSTKSPEVADSIRTSLTQAGLKDVSVSQDRDKGVVTLAGHVPAAADKAQAESIAKGIATGQVVANEIGVTPPGIEKEAKTVNSDLDKGIESNLHAALVANKLDSDVKYSVKNGVVTLTGDVISQDMRRHTTEIASQVPNVTQVVNETQVKNQKASSTQ